jgi:hypothetical protein
MTARDHGFFVDRFVAACRADDRVLAALLVGSHATGTADEHSDLDLHLALADDAYEPFMDSLGQFVRGIGEPLLEETFDLPGIVFIIFADGTDLELMVTRASELSIVGPYRVLLDRGGVVASARPPVPRSTEETRELVRRRVTWFWHDLSHLISGLGRDQLTWAYGQLDELREACLDLALLLEDPAAKPEGYWKAEASVPEDVLEELRATMVEPERDALLQSGKRVVALYRRLARQAAARHGLPYPEALDRIVFARLEALDA